MSVVIPLPVAQLTPQTSDSTSSSTSSASSAAGSFCGSPTSAATAAGCEAAESLSASSDGGFYEMTAEDIDTAGREAEDFMQFQVRN